MTMVLLNVPKADTNRSINFRNCASLFDWPYSFETIVLEHNFFPSVVVAVVCSGIVQCKSIEKTRRNLCLTIKREPC